jgi:hypothetical protein
MARGLRVVSDQITPRLQAMIDRSKSVQAFLNSVIYTMYQNFQMQRWMTEGSSEGESWPALNSTYAKYKLRRYGGGAKFKWIGGRGLGDTKFDGEGQTRPWNPIGTWPSYPGGGTKMMIGTTRLVSAIVGPNDVYNEGLRFHRKVVDATSITISVDSSEEADSKDPGSKYFEYALVARDYLFFSQSHLNDMKAALKAYVKGAA